MKELNEKLILFIAAGLSLIGVGFNLLFPYHKDI